MTENATQRADASEVASGTDTSRDAIVAFRNAFKLGGSLLFTLGIAFAIRILLPRHLGPAAFGDLNFADAFAVTTFVLVALGVDTYIRKEVPVRPEVATEIFGGLVVARLTLAVLLLGLSAMVMRATHRPPTVSVLVLLFGLGQLFMSVGGSLGAILQARGSVGGLSLVNGGAKLLWGVGILIGIAHDRALIAVAASFLAAETVKVVVLWFLARRHVGLRFRVDALATRAAIVASLPFYVNYVAYTAYGRIDVTVLSFVISDQKELGWYGAASNLAGLTLVVTPLIGWVLMPLFARAAARDREELRRIVARSVEFVLGLAILTALMVALGAELWVRLIFGPAFAPAALPLRILAAMFVLTYVATVSATCLNVLGRGWAVTVVSLTGLLLNPFLTVGLVHLAGARLGIPGAAGAGAALAMLVSEALVAAAMTALLGAMAFDRRSVRVLTRMLAAAMVVLALDRLTRPLGPGRILLDLACYLVLVLLSRAVRWQELLHLARAAFRRGTRSSEVPAAPAARAD